jgi:hypothetical protein
VLLVRQQNLDSYGFAHMVLRPHDSVHCFLPLFEYYIRCVLIGLPTHLHLLRYMAGDEERASTWPYHPSLLGLNIVTGLAMDFSRMARM